MGCRVDVVDRGDVWLVCLDPTVGSEIRKTRPCVIVSPDELNAVWRSVLIAPMTTGGRVARFRLEVAFGGKRSLILPDQIRAVAKARLVKHLGRLGETDLTRLLAKIADLFKP